MSETLAILDDMLQLRADEVELRERRDKLYARFSRCIRSELDKKGIGCKVAGKITGIQTGIITSAIQHWRKLARPKLETMLDALRAIERITPEQVEEQKIDRRLRFNSTRLANRKKKGGKRLQQRKEKVE